MPDWERLRREHTDSTCAMHRKIWTELNCYMGVTLLPLHSVSLGTTGAAMSRLLQERKGWSGTAQQKDFSFGHRTVLEGTHWPSGAAAKTHSSNVLKVTALLSLPRRSAIFINISYNQGSVFLFYLPRNKDESAYNESAKLAIPNHNHHFTILNRTF